MSFICLPCETSNTLPTPSIVRSSDVEHTLLIELDDHGGNVPKDAPLGGYIYEQHGDILDCCRYIADRPDHRTPEAYALFEERLKTVVQNNGRVHPGPPIDKVCVLNVDRVLEKRLWSILSGLHPRQLEIHCGTLEDCDLRGLDKLDPPWPPLESFVLGNAFGPAMDRIPDICRSITSLTLDGCSLDFGPTGGCDTLRNLTIISSGSQDTFAALCRANPRVFDTLERLKMINIDYMEAAYYDPTGEALHFPDALNKCTALKSLELAMVGEHTIYPSIFPAFLPRENLEHLDLRGHPNLVPQIISWKSVATDSTWLPRLKTLSFHLDYTFDALGLPDENPNIQSMVELAASDVEEFLRVFSAARPDVQILRGPTILHQPPRRH